MDHVSDVSSSQGSVVFLNFLLFQVEFFLGGRVRQDLLQSLCDLDVKRLEVGMTFHCIRVGRSQVSIFRAAAISRIHVFWSNGS